jgi:hypothetical protein
LFVSTVRIKVNLTQFDLFEAGMKILLPHYRVPLDGRMATILIE